MEKYRLSVLMDDRIVNEIATKKKFSQLSWRHKGRGKYVKTDVVHHSIETWQNYE